MNYCENTLHQIDYLKRLKKNLEKELESISDWNLERKLSNGKEYLYLRGGDERQSLQKNPDLLSIYLRKEKLEEQLKAINHNIPILDKVLGNYIPLTPVDSFWEALKSEQNSYQPNNRQNLYQGVFYRSKSEMTIAMFLTSYKLSFKYEVEVKISGVKSRYPDFCVERPKDKKVIYWEHCGLISRDTYQNDLYYKLKEYHSVGIDLWDNLILTFDQYDGGLDADTIDRVIQMYFFDCADVRKS